MNSKSWFAAAKSCFRLIAKHEAMAALDWAAARRKSCLGAMGADRWTDSEHVMKVLAAMPLVPCQKL